MTTYSEKIREEIKKRHYTPVQLRQKLEAVQVRIENPREDRAARIHFIIVKRELENLISVAQKELNCREELK